MRFCQSDGTPLVEAAEPIDPYKTMVARPEDIASFIPPLAENPVVEQPPAKEEEEVLQIPAEEVDPKKTMYASEAEIRSAMSDIDKPEEPVMDIPPYSEPMPPEPPIFKEPDLSPPSFGDAGGPPPSPFADAGSPFSKTTPPIPSPFDQPKAESSFEPPAPAFEELKPEPPIFAEPAAASNPFNDAAPQAAAPIEKSEPTTPAVQESDWQDQNNMQNPQYQPGSAVQGGGQNQTLAIVSLVVGILSLFCCAWFVPGIAALIMGFIAKGKANSDPANYGGAGLALGGIITGAISLILGVIVLILYFLGFAASLMQQGM